MCIRRGIVELGALITNVVYIFLSKATKIYGFFFILIVNRVGVI